ncbi:MAG TPA: type II toxin-antitoxin system RelE/ParE family toxin [Thermoanaerobaculia bacterium]|nr:type II toxin-antitoxin system RelE/ParE family toxin [Thermoanaerobaculia bacterium]
MTRERDPGRRSAAGTDASAGPLPLRWSRRAQADLEEIGDFIAADKPEAARRWVDKLLENARRAALLPRAGRVVPEFGMEALREILVGSYRIVYRITDREIQVITVFEGHRRFPADVSLEGDAP